MTQPARRGGAADNPQRLVVNLVADPDHGQLAESRFVDRPFLPGGEHNMYELAFAAASLGWDVELRGWLDRPAFDGLADRAGTAPKVDLPPRPPQADDLVIVPEGWREPADYLRTLLSPARLGLYILAAPGLFGWPFEAGWVLPDPVTVALDTLARPEHFQAAVALGFRLLTHSPGIVAAAGAAGIDCAFVGTGRPGMSVPAAVEKTVDVALLVDNRWSGLADGVLATLPHTLTRDRIERVSNAEVLTRLNRARILIWPSRIEGHATIPWEARSVGCVPVALDSNRFGVGLSEDCGAAIVHGVDSVGPAIEELLADPARWQDLSARGRATAPLEVDWDAYRRRVAEFLSTPWPAEPARSARGQMGISLERWAEQRADTAQASLEAMFSESEAVRRDRDRLHHEAAYWRSTAQTVQSALEHEREAAGDEPGSNPRRR